MLVLKALDCPQELQQQHRNRREDCTVQQQQNASVYRQQQRHRQHLQRQLQLQQQQKQQAQGQQCQQAHRRQQQHERGEQHEDGEQQNISSYRQRGKKRCIRQGRDVSEGRIQKPREQMKEENQAKRQNPLQGENQQQRRQQQALRQERLKLEGLEKEQSMQEKLPKHVMLQCTPRRNQQCPVHWREEAEPQHDQSKETQEKEQHQQQKKTVVRRQGRQQQKQQQESEELQEKRAPRHPHEKQHLQQEHACSRHVLTVLHFCAFVVHFLRSSLLYRLSPLSRRLSAPSEEVSLLKKFPVILHVFAFAALLEFSAAALAFTCRSASPLQAYATHLLPAGAENLSASLIAAPCFLKTGLPHISTNKNASGTAATDFICTNGAAPARGDTDTGCLYPSAFSSSALHMVKHKKYQLATDNLFIGLSDAQVQRNLRRKQMAIDYRPLRQLYIQRIQLARSMDERLDWQYRLQKLPRDSSPTRYRNRCHLCGRPRGFFRFFGLCRIHALEHIRNTDFPGFTKAEW